MLAISFGLDRFEKYVYGRHIVVETDHLPLVTIHKKSLLSSPKRLQRMLLKTHMYDYTVIYKKGVEMYLADTLSRAFYPVAEENKTTTDHIFLTDVEKEIEEINMVDYVSVSAMCLTELQTATKSDKQLCRLMKIIMSGWPDDKKSMREDLKSYYTFWEEMSVQDGLIFKGDRIVVPTSMQTEIKERLHSSHVGVQGCLRRAREAVYWPNMNADIESYISRCSTCNSIQRNQAKEPMIAHAIPELSWQHVACGMWLVRMWWSRLRCVNWLLLGLLWNRSFEWWAIKRSRAKTESAFHEAWLSGDPVFGQWPSVQLERLCTFAEDFWFEHITSSPRYPRSNGKSESAGKVAKTLMMKSKDAKTDPYLALLELRNVPTEKMEYSPVQRLFGRRTRTKLPIAKRLLKPETCTRVVEKLLEKKARQAFYYDRGAKELKPLERGQVARIHSPGYRKWKKAVVDDQTDVRSYAIRTEDGRRYRRNRSHLRTTTESFSETTQQMLEQ